MAIVVAMCCFVLVACDNTVPNSGNSGVSSGFTDAERMEALRQGQSSQAQQEGMRTDLRERQASIRRQLTKVLRPRQHLPTVAASALESVLGPAGYNVKASYGCIPPVSSKRFFLIEKHQD